MTLCIVYYCLWKLYIQVTKVIVVTTIQVLDTTWSFHRSFRSHFRSPGSWIPLNWSWVPGPRFQCRGPRSQVPTWGHFSCMLLFDEFTGDRNSLVCLNSLNPQIQSFICNKLTFYHVEKIKNSQKEVKKVWGKIYFLNVLTRPFRLTRAYNKYANQQTPSNTTNNKETKRLIQPNIEHACFNN